MPSKTELTMEEVAYHDDDAKFVEEIKKAFDKYEKFWEDFSVHWGNKFRMFPTHFV